MRANQDTSCILKSEDRASKIPNIVGFIIIRILPIGSLSFFLYKTLTEVVLDGDQYLRMLIINTIACIMVHSGILYSSKYDSIKLEELGSRQAWLDTLNSTIKTWVKGNGPVFRCFSSLESEDKYIQCEKEVFAAYLAGSRQGIPPPFSSREARYRLTIWIVYTFVVLRLASADILPALAQSIMWSSIFLWLPASFLIGRRLGRSVEMGGAVEKVRKECESIDVEKGEDIREQLEWWIEAILKEESDSDALAKQRMEVIIAPLLRAVRC